MKSTEGPVSSTITSICTTIIKQPFLIQAFSNIITHSLQGESFWQLYWVNAIVISIILRSKLGLTDVNHMVRRGRAATEA